ncbi:MAG: guanylate kinase [bacterium]
MSKIIVCGPACSGKDTLVSRFVNRGFRKDVSYTTRPKRENEIDGEDYHFISKKGFEELIQQGRFYEYVIFKGNYYGTLLDSWENSDIFIMEPQGINHLSAIDRVNAFIIYLDINENERINRMRKERSWTDEQIRSRINIDNEAFSDFKDYDLKITNINF